MDGDTTAHLLDKMSQDLPDNHCSSTAPTEQGMILFICLMLYVCCAVMSGKRLKRHHSEVLEKTIELGLVIDRPLYQMHKENLTDYVLHIMNTVRDISPLIINYYALQVTHLYKDPSIGSASNVNIALVKLIVWNDTTVSCLSARTVCVCVSVCVCVWLCIG